MSQLQQKKKICLFCEKWSAGGIETYLAENISHMDRAKLELHLVISAKDSGIFDDLLGKCKVQIHLLGKDSAGGSFERIVGVLKPFGRLCRTERFDLVHLNVFHGVALLLAWEARRSGVSRIAVHCHGSGLRRSRGFWIKVMGHLLCKYLLQNTPTERWATSETAGKFLFPSHWSFEVLPNGIETRRFRYNPKNRNVLRRELEIGDRWVIGCVGRLEDQKNQRFLLELLPELPKECGILLVGEGEERDRLEQRATELGIKDRVIFAGYRRDIEKLYCVMDVLAVPSWNEGLSRTAIEGQASGLPVVCSQGVPREASVGKDVRFIPLTDQESWLRLLQKHRVLDRLKENDRIAVSNYDIQRSAAMLQKRYEGK